MRGEYKALHRFMEGTDITYIIPVYQRNYDWKIEHCARLFDDLVMLSRENIEHHFFGSIVNVKAEDGGKGDYSIIDGQQRLTTVSLLLKALSDLIASGEIEVETTNLYERIVDVYLINRFAPENSRIRLKPIKSDSDAYQRIIQNKESIPNSNITVNYNYFVNRIKKQELTADELFASFQKLTVIDIFLDDKDNPQLIFESLNSTGLDLSEGDKIRNFILMNIPSVKEQEHLYEQYWHKIELNTNYDTSMFIRDYLSVKTKSTPPIARVYENFKEHYNKMLKGNAELTKEDYLKDLLEYSNIYFLIIASKTGYFKVDQILVRLNRLDFTVIRPFLLEAIALSPISDYSETKLSVNDLENILIIVESYLFRRMMNSIPTNALNKIFVRLNNDIYSLDGNYDNYVEKMKYILLSKTASGIFPDDAQFSEAIEHRDVYLMSSKNRRYIFDRLENQNYKEVHDVWSKLENNVYTIEHIMPQKLNKQWRKDLGEDANRIHDKWLHRLANLTITAYNSEYSNSPFSEKRENYSGYKHSGIRLTASIGKFDKWTEEELLQRNHQIVRIALELWPMIESSYTPKKIKVDRISLGDEVSFTNRKVIQMEFLGKDFELDSWRKALQIFVEQLIELDSSKFLSIANEESKILFPFYFDELRGADSNFYYVLSNGILMNVKSDTNTKINTMRALLNKYEIEENEVIFTLDPDTKPTNISGMSRSEILKDFWTYVINDVRRDTRFFHKFENNTVDNTVFTSIKGHQITIYLRTTRSESKVFLNIGSRDRNEVDEIFNRLLLEKEQFEESTNSVYEWVNDPKKRTAQIIKEKKDLSFNNLEDWESIADFFVEYCNHFDRLVSKVFD